MNDKCGKLKAEPKCIERVGLDVRALLRFSLIVAICLIVVAYPLLTFMSQQEAPLWILQYTFYAFMTAIFGFIFLGILAPLIRERLKNRKRGLIEEKRTLQSLETVYEKCLDIVKGSIQKSLGNGKSVTLTARLYEQNILGDKTRISLEMQNFQAIQKRVQRHNEKCETYNALQKGSETLIRKAIENEVKKQFPKTVNKGHTLDEYFQADFLMTRYLNGEKLTESWFKETHPVVFKNIMTETEETERDGLNTFFHILNSKFANDNVLIVFRKEKDGLAKQGKEIIAELEREIDCIKKKLKKYRHLGNYKDTMIKYVSSS